MQNRTVKLLAFFLILLTGFLLQGGRAQALPPVTQFLWDYDFTQPNSRACSTTITTACVSGFTVQTIVQPSFAVIAGPVAIPLPGTINTTGPTVGISSPFTPPSAMGNYQIWVTVNWKDSSGAAQTAPTASLGFAVVPVVPANLRTQ